MNDRANNYHLQDKIDFTILIFLQLLQKELINVFKFMQEAKQRLVRDEQETDKFQDFLKWKKKLSKKGN
jgi:hypothetical protein